MSVVRMTQDQAAEPRAVSGSGMDRIVARKRLPRSLMIAGAALAMVAIALLIWWIVPRGSTSSCSVLNF